MTPSDPRSPASVLPDSNLPATPTTTGRDKQKPQPLMGPVRVQLEAFGVAILGAVLLKWFCIEAFQIPTSSMQPTLMGGAGVYDRILVNKMLQLVREPKRWDITVFSYPLQKNQNYVKRIGGMPGDRLTIAGGNLYQVSEQAGKLSYRVERKPADLQESMWKNVHPLRQQVRAETTAIGGALAASPERLFREDGGDIVVDLKGAPVQLYYRDETDGGMVDRVWDGYPVDVARVIREETHNGAGQQQEIVPDVRIAATLTAAQLDEFAFEIEVKRPSLDTLVYALAAKGGKARLQVRSKGKVEKQSEEFDLALPAGTAVEVAFAHVDDELVAWCFGREVARFDSSELACRDGCVVSFHAGREQAQNQRVVPQITAKGTGELRIADLRIDRDQHYTRSTAPELIEVPEGHYYMLGDNTLQSIDSRGWTAVTIGVDANNNVVPPDTPGARVVRGNKRAMPLSRPPDRDETPIPIPSEKALIMIDEYGEILRLNAEVGPDWGEPPAGRIAFLRPGATDGNGEWEAPNSTNSKGISFVPRADIRGRATFVFYPCRPFSWLMRNNWPDRAGFVR